MDNPSLPDSFALPILDIEASGIATNSYPIEIAVLRSDTSRYESLIIPAAQWQHWDDDAELIHGISREILSNQGMDARTVALQLNDFCQGQTIYSDCWTHDSRWLQILFDTAEINMNFRCSALDYVLSESEMENWANSKNIVHQKLGLAPHRAMNDAIVIATTADQLISKRFSLQPASPRPARKIDLFRQY